MKLLKDMFIQLMQSEPIQPVVGLSEESLCKLLTDACYQALSKIQSIIQDDALEDFRCIEEIVCVFESIGSDGGNRHDFG